LQSQTHAFVDAFDQRFQGLAQSTPSPTELDQATRLLAQHGEPRSHFLLTYTHQAARETAYRLQVFGNILPYLPQALAAYDAQATWATQTRTQQMETVERACYARYRAWQQQELARLRAALSPAELAALEATERARLVVQGTTPVTLEFDVHLPVDAVLDARAGLSMYEAWRAAQRTAGEADHAA
jgi:hypothetical protein